MSDVLVVALLGTGATAATDLWGFVRQRLLGVPAPDFALVGRWIGHMWQGRFRHAAIVRSAPVRGEAMLGWCFHYLTGIAFAALLVLIAGRGWVQAPTPGPAMLVGLSTVTAPFLLMQPAMGGGLAASRSARPWAARSQSLLLHAAFGAGLYLAALALRASGIS